MVKKNYLMDFILLIMIGGVYVSHFILGNEHFLVSILRVFVVMCATFYAGLLADKYYNSPKVIWNRFIFYFILFISSGLTYDVVKSGKTISQSLSNMLTLIKVPKYSELFFTVTVLMLISGLMCKYTHAVKRYRYLLISLSIIALFIAYLPKDVFGYPIIGIFLGCDKFNCIALLPALGYFISGIYHENIVSTKSLKWGISALIISALSCILYITGYTEIARYTVVCFPVYLLFKIYCFISNYYEFPDIPGLLKNKAISYIRTFADIMKRSQKKHLPVYFLVYTLIFSVTAFFTFAVFRENNNSFIWNPDGLSQYYPKAYYFCTYMRELFTQFTQGDFTIPAYDFSLGMGRGISFSHEPIYYLFALFNPSDIEYAFNILLLLRYFLAGASMSVLLLYFRHSFSNSLIGSIMYAFSGFALIAGVRHPQFIPPMILLPLLIIATEEIIRHKRWYLCPPVVAVSLLCGYYFHYINTIMIGIYYLARFIFTKNKEMKNLRFFIKTTFQFGFTYILGVLIGNITLTTSFASYLGSSRPGHKLIPTDSFFFYQGTWFKRCLSAFISMPETPGYVLRLGFVPLAVIGVIILFMKQEKKILKFFFILLSLFCIFPVAGYALSGFSNVTNRWSYVCALVITVITVYALTRLTSLTKKELKIMFFAIIPYILFVFFDRDYRSVTTMASVGILLLVYIIILFMNNNVQLINRKYGKIALLITCITSITINSYYQYTEGGETSITSYSAQNTIYGEVTDSPLRALDTIDDDTFYRAGTSNNDGFRLSNASYILGYNGVTEFTSTINGCIMDYSSYMGNSTSTVVRLKGFDNRTFIHSLACMKYYAVDTALAKTIPYGYDKLKEVTMDDKTYDLYLNKYVLPLGYTYDSAISETELLNNKTLDRQEVLMQSVSLPDSSETLTQYNHSESLNLSSQELTITKAETDGLTIVDDHTILMTKPTATLTLYFDNIPDSETYLEFSGNLIARNDLRGTSVYMTSSFEGNSNTYQIPAVNHSYNTHQDVYLFNLGYQEDNVNSCTLTFTSSDSHISDSEPHTFSIESFKVYGQSMEHYQDYIHALQEDVLEDIVVDTNTVSGNITLEEDKILVLSIPYEKGWTAYVDDVETRLEKANLMYTALSLSEGSHSIKLVYETPGQTLSYIISAAGIAIYIVLLVLDRIRHKRNGGIHYEKI